MSTGAVSGGGSLSLDAMILQVNQSNSEAQLAIAEDASESFKANKAQAEASRDDVRRERVDVVRETEALDAHIAKEPEWWDKFNPFTKGAIHEKQTEAQAAAVERESTDVAREQIELKADNKRVSDSLERAGDAVDNVIASFKDTTAMLQESADVSEMILGRITV